MQLQIILIYNSGTFSQPSDVCPSQPAKFTYADGELENVFASLYFTCLTA
jgi:hypothetical protein